MVIGRGQSHINCFLDPSPDLIFISNKNKRDFPPCACESLKLATQNKRRVQSMGGIRIEKMKNLLTNNLASKSFEAWFATGMKENCDNGQLEMCPSNESFKADSSCKHV